MRELSRNLILSLFLWCAAGCALTAMIYRFALPQSFHSFAARRSEAVQLLGTVQGRLDRECALIVSLTSSSTTRQGAVRGELQDNEAEFRELLHQVIAKLPEASAELTVLVTKFDELSEIGRHFEEALRQDDLETALALLNREYLPRFRGLRLQSMAIQRNLERADTRLDLPDH